MKYAKKWKEDIASLPPFLRKDSINYKVWKKQIKRSNFQSIHDAIASLQKECKKVDKTFCKCFSQCTKSYVAHASCFGCTHPSHHPNTSITSLQHYVTLNATTVYKISKKLSKTFASDIATSWLEAVRTRNVFQFISGPYKAYMNMMVNKIIECPICLNDSSDIERVTQFFILSCGHVVCADCAFAVTSTQNIYGTWYNRFRNARNTVCPVCRSNTAFSKTEDILSFRVVPTHIEYV